MQKIVSFNEVQEKILPKLMGAEMNEDLLANGPHIMMADLAVTYWIMLSQNELFALMTPITNDLMEEWNISIEALHDIATNNMIKNFPPSIQDLNEVVASLMNNEEEMCPLDDGKAYVLSNEQKFNGAVSILDKKTMSQVAEIVGYNKFFIVPSSIHDLLVIPMTTGISTAELRQMVRVVNATKLEPQDRLSYNVYIYDATKHQLIVAD